MIGLTRRRPLALAFAVAVAALVPAAGPISAQDQPAEEPATPSRFNISIGLLNTQPLGELRTGPGLGGALSGTYALDARRIFRLRGDFRASIYDHDRRRVCAGGTIGCWIRLDVNTNYSSIYGGVGPEIVLPLGPVDLALAGTAGIGSFSVSSSLKGVDDRQSFGETNHFDDLFFAWSTGAELRVPVARKVAISLGSHYQHNGRASYVVEGGITERPDGSLEVSPLTTDANMVAIVLGVSIRP